MSLLSRRIQRQAAILAGAVLVIINLVAVSGSVHVSATVLGGLNAASAAVLALLVTLVPFIQLSRVRNAYVREARETPERVVPTARGIAGEVFGRDELCRVLIEAVRDRRTRCPQVLVGGTGTGRTAMLVRLTKLLAEQGFIPVPIALREAQENLDFSELARRRFLAQAGAAMLADADADKLWRQLREDDKIVVLADDLEQALLEGDVVWQRREYLIDRGIRMARENRLPLIIASLPHDLLRETEAAIVDLEPLSNEAALQYVQSVKEGGSDPSVQRENERSIRWVIERADVTEAPLYLQIVRELHGAGLLRDSLRGHGYRLLDTRDVDRSQLRLWLLHAWKEALVRGYFPAGAGLSRDARISSIDRLSELACAGLGQDRLRVGLEEIGSLRISGEPDPVVREARKRLDALGHRSSDIRLNAIWGARLGLVEEYGGGVVFTRGILQAYLGSRLIMNAMADDHFLGDALLNSGRDLLIALVMHTRATMEQAGPARPAEAGTGAGSLLAGSIDLRMLLCTAAARRADAKALDLYATALEIDSVNPAPEHQAIASEIAGRWPALAGSDAQAPVHRKLDLVLRFGEAARAMTARRSRTGEPAGLARPAYRQLFDIACRERSHQVRLAAAHEIGAGGDDALADLEEVLGPPVARRGQAPAGPNGDHGGAAGDREDEGEPGPVSTAPDQFDQEEIEEQTQRQEIMQAWLVPLLVGSVAGGEPRAAALQLLERWLEFVRAQHRQADRAHIGLSLEIALAQGFKYAANRRHENQHVRLDAWDHLEEQAREMLAGCDFWFTRLTLLHALVLLNVTDAPELRSSHGRGTNHRELVAYWCEMDGDWRRNRPAEHPFVAEAKRLSVRALETGQPQRYIWIDESEIVSRVGSRPASPASQLKRNLWIPPSTGWTALDGKAQQLVADVLLLLNLAERGERLGRDRDRRLQRTNRNRLPPCLAGDLSRLDPARIAGMAAPSEPGSNCEPSCMFALCPYPPKGEATHRIELSGSFCRRQALMNTRPILRSSAPWQAASRRKHVRFWRRMVQRAQT